MRFVISSLLRMKYFKVFHHCQSVRTRPPFSLHVLITSMSFLCHLFEVYEKSHESSIYQFNASNPETPVKAFSGTTYQVGTFYIKSTVSSDGRFLCSGSTDSNLHVWEINGRPRAPPIVLIGGHSKEITGVAWCGQDSGQVRIPYRL